MTPKQQYEARKAERAKLKDMEYQAKQATETVMILDTLDRFVTAVERIADAMERPSAPTFPLGPMPQLPETLPLCGCKAGTLCMNIACPYRTPITANTPGAQ